MTPYRERVSATSGGESGESVPDSKREDSDGSPLGLAAGLEATHEQVMAAYMAGTSDEGMIRRQDGRGGSAGREER
jgi:hypothetical protein